MNKPLTKALVLVYCIIIVLFSCNDSKNSTKDKPDAEATSKEAVTIKEDNPKTSDIAETPDCCIHVDADKTNILYIGVDNLITIKAPNEVEISLSGEGTISKIDSIGKYIVNVNGGREAYIIVKHLNDTSCRVYKKYAVRKLPNPVVSLGTLRDNEIATKGTIRANSIRLFASLENRDFSLRFTIVSYTFVLITSTRSYTVTSNSSILSSQIMNLISALKSGDKLIFHNIRASGPDGIRLLNSIVITAR
jgi:hypothetical protein